MSLSVVPHNVSPIRRKAILREHVDQRAREYEGAQLSQQEREIYASQTLGLLSAIVMFLSVLGLVMLVMKALLG